MNFYESLLVKYFAGSKRPTLNPKKKKHIYFLNREDGGERRVVCIECKFARAGINWETMSPEDQCTALGKNNPTKIQHLVTTAKPSAFGVSHGHQKHVSLSAFIDRQTKQKTYSPYPLAATVCAGPKDCTYNKRCGPIRRFVKNFEHKIRGGTINSLCSLNC